MHNGLSPSNNDASYLLPGGDMEEYCVAPTKDIFTPPPTSPYDDHSTPTTPHDDHSTPTPSSW